MHSFERCMGLHSTQQSFVEKSNHEEEQVANNSSINDTSKKLRTYLECSLLKLNMNISHYNVTRVVESYQLTY